MRTPLRLCVAFGATILTTLAMAGAAMAAPPANDNFADRASLTSGEVESGSNVEATIEGGESFFAYGLNHSVWYEYMPASNGVLALTTCSSFPVNLIGMTGDLGSLSAASFSPVSYTQSAVSGACAYGNLATVNVFPVVSGVPIKIHVGSAFAANTGNFDLTATFTSVPVNDDFANAITLTDEVTASGSNLYATVEVDEEQQPYANQRSVWYTFTPTAKGVVSINLCSAFPAHLVTWTGSAVDNLSIAGYSPQSYGASVASSCESGTRELTSLVDFPVAANVPLRIQVMGKLSANMGDFDITADFKPLPANDDFADAITLTSGSTVTGNNSYATVELDEEQQFYAPYRSVWYTFTPAFSGELEIETCSAFPAHVVAWTGNSVSALTMHSFATPSYVASTAAGCDSGTRDFAYVAPQTVTSGVPIRIQVMGKNANDMGSFSIRVELHSTPDNDAFASATDLGSVASTTVQDDNFATTANQPSEPLIVGSSRPGSTWYRWQAPVGGPVTIETCDDLGTNTSIGVFTTANPTPALSNLTAVTNGAATGGCSSGNGAKVTVDVESGSTYWIAVANDSAANRHGRFNLSIGLHPVNVASPDLTGDDYFVGTELTVDTGTWIGRTPITLSQQWQRCDETGDNCADISGETGLTYTLATEDKDKTVRAVVTGTNAVGTGVADTGTSALIDADTDGDSIGDRDDLCPEYEAGSGKTNGCPTEVIFLGSSSSISGSAVLGGTLTLNVGSANNSPGRDPDLAAPAAGITWLSCETATYSVPTCRTLADTDTSYTITETNDPGTSDGGRYIRAIVNWTNGDGASIFNFAPSTAQVVDDCPSELQGGGKTNGCAVSQVSVTTQPTISGTPAVGQTLGITPGAAVSTGADPDVEDPSAPTSTRWFRCDAAVLSGTCAQVATGENYTVTSADQGKFLAVSVTWSNGEDSDDGVVVSTQVPVLPPPATPPAPAPTDPLTLTVKKSLGTVKRDKKGFFTFKGAVVACGAAATGPCTGTVAISAKVGKKTVRYGAGKTGQASGKSAAVSFKPNAKLAKAIKKAKGKKLKVTLVFSVSAPGFPAQTATATATLR